MADFDPNRWLLPVLEPQVPRSWRLWQSLGEFVYVHDSYQSYFARLAQLFEEAGDGDEIFLVGWQFMLRETELVPGKTAEGILQRAAGRHVRIRLLTPGGRPVRAKGVDAMEDYQAINIHHQKAVYLTVKKVPSFFVGGMDIALGFGAEPRLGYWFDAQAEIRGPAASLGKASLEERWASVYGTPAPLVALSGVSAYAARVSGKSRTVCQFVRSYSEKVPAKDPHGRTRQYSPDASYGALLKRVIERATKSIYLEDQFFVSSTAPPNLDQLLTNAVARGVTLVVVTARGPQVNMDHGPLVRRLTGSISQKNRVFIFQMKDQPTPKPYFVHTKTWIVDDQAVIVGTANYWDRSMIGDDTELGVGIVSDLSENGLTFGHALRVRLWNRLLKAVPGAGAVSVKSDIVDEVPALANALERL